MATLETHYRDLCDIEFTIERGKLWMLQTRVGKRTAAAAFRIATQLVDEGLIDMDEALRRVTGDQLAQLMFPRFDPPATRAAARQGHERLARRRGRQGGVRLRDAPSSGRARARRSSWSAGRPTPTTSPA
jgi:pyruvate,orthophosphate dikinase